tara:strand:+ start:6576 stop:7988 length:1413 start_codon:yes stop_codon:yes gene_type:complete
MIKEERENIIANNNTAQDKFVTFVEKLTKPVKKVSVLDVLEGDLNLNIFKEMNLGIPEEISFKEGKITSIINIPDGVKILNCTNNLLIEIENLPTSLEELTLEYNYLDNIDISNLKNLEKLNVSHNNIQELNDIPSSLIELKCTHNKLENINLKDLHNLRTLHISNNLITIIENLPDGIVDFQQNNLPSYEIRNSNISALKDHEEVERKKQKNDFYKDLNKYFKIKRKYENKKKELKKKAYEKAKTKKMAKLAVQNVKVPCVKCKRSVGTIFSLKDNTYSAICGDDKTPCKLNIKLFSGYYEQLTEGIQLFKYEVDNTKTKIVSKKLDNIFGYTEDEPAKLLYEDLLKEYNKNNQMYLSIVDKYEQQFENENKKTSIANKKRELYKYLDQNKEILNEYKKTENNQLIKDIVANNVNNVFREARNIRELENEIVQINYYKEENIFKVFKYPVLLQNTEETITEAERVQFFE